MFKYKILNLPSTERIGAVILVRYNKLHKYVLLDNKK